MIGRMNDLTGLSVNDSDKHWLKDRFGLQVLFDEPMSRHTTFGIGGPADVLITVETDEQIKDLARWCSQRGQPMMILGAGSNLLVRDGGIRGLVLKLGKGFETIKQVRTASPNGSVEVQAGAGVLLRHLAKYALDRGLAGLDFGLGIPGTVGGGIRMNAGAWGSCMADTLSSISVLRQKGDIVTVNKANLRFSYRGVDLEERSIILRGHFHLKRADRETLRKDAVQMQKKRRSSQPLSLPSAGCIFRNPAGQMSAGELIDKAGLKGFRKGGAEISTKHGNFIVNQGHARAADVLALMGHAKEAVFKRFGVNLELEVVVVGEEADSQKLL
jgi:UDP-N-acetylmuramate dehydrogenase